MTNIQRGSPTRTGQELALDTSKSYRHDIQGLRAIAILSVVMFHAFPAALPGGFVGIDVFFVISGNLITDILLRDLKAGRFSIRKFYVRRIQRILPALVVVVAIVLLAGYFLLSPYEYRELARTVVSTAIFASNFDFWNLTGYFDGEASLKPLLHTWSLAIEGQFYFFYPPLLYFLWRSARKEPVWTLLGLSCVFLTLSEAMVRMTPLAAYLLSPARAFELLIGAVIAATRNPFAGAPFAKAVISLVGLSSIGAPLLLYTSRTPFPGVAALIPCLGTALVLFVGKEVKSFGGHLISGRMFRLIGNLSYSLYLWHWPLLLFARRIWGPDLSTPVTSAIVAASIVFATLSYLFVERPCLSKEIGNLPCSRLSAAIIALIATTGIAVYALQGLPGRYSPEARSMFAFANDFNKRRGDCHDTFDLLYEKNCVFGAAQASPDLAVWADSHGAEMVVALGERAQISGRSVMQITASSCPPALHYVVRGRPRCSEHNRKTVEALVDDARISTVLMAAQLSGYPDPYRLQCGLEEAVEALVRSGKRVIIVLPIPVMISDPPSEVGRNVEWHRDPNMLGRPRADYYAEEGTWRAFLIDLSRRLKVEVFDPANILCDSVRCHIFDQSAGVLYFDRKHLSLSGARFVVRNLANRLYGH